MPKPSFKFRGCRENPFAVNPDPRFLLLAPRVENAFTQIISGLHAKAGLITLTGEAGTGKTTLMYRLLDALHQSQVPTAFIFNACLDVDDLWILLLTEFALPQYVEAKEARFRRFHEWLAAERTHGRAPVLIVDEAQGLAIEPLEELRHLLDLTIGGQPLLQIVLCGQPELEETLRRRELRAVRDRVAIRCKTRALTLDETHAYLTHRLALAGAGDAPVFHEDAIRAIYRCSHGIPRLVNLVGERSLIRAHAQNLSIIPESVIRYAAQDFDLEERIADWRVIAQEVHKPAMPEVCGSVVGDLARRFAFEPRKAIRAIGNKSGEATSPVALQRNGALPISQPPAFRAPAPASTPDAAKPAVVASPKSGAEGPSRFRRLSPLARAAKARIAFAGVELQRSARQFVRHLRGECRHSGVRVLDFWRIQRRDILVPFLRYWSSWIQEVNAQLRPWRDDKWAADASLHIDKGLEHLRIESLRIRDRIREYVPGGPLPPSVRKRCAEVWSTQRRTFEYVMQWLRGPLPF